MKEMTDEIDYELIHRIVAHVIKEEAAKVSIEGDRGAILIFVPGWAEIGYMHRIVNLVFETLRSWDMAKFYPLLFSLFIC